MSAREVRPRGDVDIQRADPAARRRALLVVVVAAAAGTIVLVLLDRWLPPRGSWAGAGQSRSGAARVFAWLNVLLTAPVFVFAAYLGWLGHRVIRAGRFPLASMRVYRDTAVLTGRAAERRGRLFQTLGIALAALAIAIAGLAWHLASLLGQAAP